MWVQFTSPYSLDQWIHYFFTGPGSLQPVNSLKIRWNHLTYKDTFSCNNLNSKIWLVTCHFLYSSHFVHLHYHLFGPWWCDFSHLSQSRGFDFIVKRSPKWHSWSFTHLWQLEYFRVFCGWGHYQNKVGTTDNELPMFKVLKRIWRNLESSFQPPTLHISKLMSLNSEKKNNSLASPIPNRIWSYQYPQPKTKWPPISTTYMPNATPYPHPTLKYVIQKIVFLILFLSN